MNILVTGGAGYIGSHTVVQLILAGHRAVILDNLCNASPKVLPRLATITGQEIPFYKGDIRDKDLLRQIFAKEKIDAVMHFAGLKAVGESVAKPLKYYDNNVSGTLVLLEAMVEVGVLHLIFSSSATVYGEANTMPLTEDMPTGGTTNPYGTSKYMVERILQDLQKADNRLSIVLLRYFNPVGAHDSGMIGENPNGIPNNLLPYVCQVAVGRLPEVSVFGSDYPTHDGSGVRDYIHVVDLAEGHIKALEKHHHTPGTFIYNLGTGQGYSVLDIIHTFEQENSIRIPYRVVARRTGDVATCYANATKAKEQLGWEAKRTLAQMLSDAWRWQKNNPNGYDPE